MGEVGDDDRLVARIAAGDRRAFAEVMERHVDRVLGLARRVLQSEADAEEVTQEVFLTVWQKAESWRPGRARFSTWLYRVTLNRCLNRKTRVQQRYLPLAPDYDPPDQGPGAEERLLAQERQQQVDAAIADLPVKQRMAISLTYVTGIGNAEAAAAMEISVKALEALLVRARRSLRQRLLAEE